jgi:hypothetical protein
MKTLIFSIFFYTLINLTYADESHCHEVAGSSLINCVEQPEVTSDVAECNELTQNNDQSMLNTFTEAKPSIIFCDQNMLYGGKKPTRKEIEQREKDLRKMCTQKAGEYKRAVAKELLGGFKLGQFVQAAFKSKKKIIRNSKKNKKETFDITQELSLAEIGNMTKAEFNQYMLAKIRQKVPNIDEVMAATQSRQISTGSFDQQESFPLSIVIQSKKGESCLVDVPEFPEEEAFTPSECELCKDTDLQNNFTNDCSYMVSADLSEEQAREMVGAGAKQVKGKDTHCNNDMKGVTNDMAEIHQTADRLCQIAQEGLVPHFEIKTSRNLFHDYTTNLAEKRGEFTQTYLYQRLQKNCELKEKPTWLNSREHFNQQIKVVYPEYKRANNMAGDYGPNPYAEGEARKVEQQALAQTLQAEMEQYQKEIQSLNAHNEEKIRRLSTIDLEINGDKKNPGLKQHYQDMTDELKKADLRVMQDQQVALSQVAQQAHLAMGQKHKLQQEIHNNSKRISAINEILNSAKYEKVGGEFKLEQQLQQFYADKDARGMTAPFREEWDQTFFNQFKMARISGNTSKVNEFGIDEEMMTPELSLMLKSLVELQTFTCVLEPIETKRTTFEGVLKAPLKFLTAATLPVIGIVGAGAAIVAAPITTGISLFCQGCREPGTTPPILKFGNLFHLNLSKPSRKAAWRSAKGFVKNYVNWGGVLKVNNKKLYTKHELDKFSRKNKNKKYSEMEDIDQENVLDVFMEDIKNTDQVGCVSAPRGSDKIGEGTEETGSDENQTSER